MLIPPRTPSALDDFTDVIVTGVSVDDILYWNGSAWVNGSAAGIDTDAIHDNVAGEIAAIAAATPAAADVFVFEDADDSWNKKKGWIDSLPGGGGGDADAIHDNVAAEIVAITAAAPDAADVFVFEDASDGWNKKRTWIDSLPGGASDDDAIHDNVAKEIYQIASDTITGDDVIIWEDRSDGWAKKKTWVDSLPGGSGTDEDAQLLAWMAMGI